MTVLVCVAMVVPAGALSAVTAVYISIASPTTIAAVEEGFGRGLVFLQLGGCLDLDAHNLTAAECLTHNTYCIVSAIDSTAHQKFVDVLCMTMSTCIYTAQ